MARPLRVDFPNAIHHVTARALDGQFLYEDDYDRSWFLADLRRVVKRYAWLVHAYCLMGSHYHLTVETPRGNLSIGVRQLNGVYAQGFNERRGRRGHLFQSRFKSRLVERDPHLLEVCRYIELNPVRAGLCRHPRDWRWSSYRFHVGLEPPPSFLTTTWVAAQFGRTVAAGRRGYAAFVEDALDAPGPPVVGEIYLGSRDFAWRASLPHEPVREVPRAHWQPVRPTIESLLADEPERGVLIACQTYGYRLSEVARVLGVHYSTVSRRLRRLELGASGGVGDA